MVREHGKPMPIVPNPIRETMSPFLPRGRCVFDSASMSMVMRELGIMMRGGQFACFVSMMCVVMGNASLDWSLDPRYRRVNL